MAKSIGEALQVLVSPGSAAINYVAQVLTHVTLCCHSLREMTLMSLSPECNCRLSVTLHANSKKETSSDTLNKAQISYV